MTGNDTGARQTPRFDPARTLTVVSGLPRAGTSLLMQMLAAAGLALAVDERRGPDADNPRGYYELDAVRRIRDDASFLQALAGRAVKIVVPLVRELPADLDHRVLLVERDLTEVLASQRAMLLRRGEAGEAGASGADQAEQDRRLAELFERRLRDVRARLEAAPNVALHVVAHGALIARPEATSVRIAEFLERTGALVDADGRAIDATLAARRMAAVVDPSLHRWRAGPGIASGTG